MAYYIYENWQAGPHKAVVHIGSCGFCNNGLGLSGGSDPKHGKWHGPYETLSDAVDIQKGLRVDVGKECSCIKRNHRSSK